MRSHKYPSDVTDEQWALIEPLIPVYPGGRPRKTDLRDVLDAIFYLLRTGCQWRYLPKGFRSCPSNIATCGFPGVLCRSAPQIPWKNGLWQQSRDTTRLSSD